MLIANLAMLLSPFVPAPFAARPAAELFRDITYDDALTAADKEDKVVMIDFFTTWCGPCKELDKTTWKDEGVLKWADDNAVCVKLDAEIEVDLAKRYKVDAYPTIVLLDATGKEIDRLVGYRDGATFLDEVGQALKGIDAVARAYRKFEGKENEPSARQKYADALAQSGRYDEALAHYLWCWDNGRNSPGYGGVRLSFLLNRIQRVAAHLPEARKALVERRDKADEKLVANPKDYEAVVDAVALNGSLKETKHTIAMYDRLKKAGPMDPFVRKVFERELAPVFLADKRYQDALDLYGDPKARVDESIKRFADMQRVIEATEEDKPEMAKSLAMVRTSTLTDCARVYEACLGAGKQADAVQVADKVVAFAPEGATYAALIDAAGRAERIDAAKALGERGLSALIEKEHKPVRKALEKLEKPK